MIKTYFDILKKNKIIKSDMVEYYFQAWTKDSTKPIMLWVIATNQIAARSKIMQHNPYITKLMFVRTKRID